MAKIILVLGGARSGKSTFALKLAQKYKKNVAFVATCQALDKEMSQRISLHKKNRPKEWDTFEECTDISSLLSEISSNYKCIIIDCLTLLVSNLYLSGITEKSIEAKITTVLKTIKRTKTTCIIVSNEVGLGIVPANKVAREFRDIAGRINQLFAREADEVFFTVSSIPVKIKRSKNECDHR